MAIKDNWVLLQNSYSVVSVWGTEDTFIQHGFRTTLVLNNEDIFYLASLLIQDGFSMGHCCTEVVFIQHGFRTPLVPDISKAKIFVITSVLIQDGFSMRVLKRFLFSMSFIIRHQGTPVQPINT